MEILQSGNTLKVEQCEECGCIFRYVKNDITKNIQEHLLIGMPLQEYVNCPECNHRNILTTTISL